MVRQTACRYVTLRMLYLFAGSIFSLGRNGPTNSLSLHHINDIVFVCRVNLLLRQTEGLDRAQLAWAWRPAAAVAAAMVAPATNIARRVAIVVATLLAAPRVPWHQQHTRRCCCRWLLSTGSRQASCSRCWPCRALLGWAARCPGLEDRAQVSLYMFSSWCRPNSLLSW